MALFASNDLAIAVGGDTVWLANGPKGPVSATPAYVTHSGGRVLAAGEEALRMPGKEPGNLTVSRMTREGGFGEPELATAFLRYVLARNSRFRLLPPRVLAVWSNLQKRGVCDIIVKAGASKVVTILPAMAAAIGAGVPIDEPAFNGVFVLDRDCCSFAIISLNGIVASFDLPGGVDLLIEDFAIHALATRGIALEPNSIHEAFRARGIAGSEILGWEAWAGELETGRSAVAAASNGDFLRSSAPFA